jgi:pyruvate dehydrogenase E2 component (dihydrolipoamide acetyltransferase)
MANATIKVPDIGDFADVEIIEIHVKPGDEIQAEDPLITLESDKASMDVPAPQSGRVSEILVKLGDRISEGSEIIVLESGAADSASPEDTTASAPEPATSEQPPETAPAPQPAPTETAAGGDTEQPPRQPPPAPPPTAETPSFAKVHASPTVRYFARELGVDLNQVNGSGRKGRITRSDVQQHVKQVMTGRAAPAATTAGAGIPPIPAVDFAQFGEIEEQPLGRIQKLSGPHLHRAWLNVPMVTHHDEADVTELEAFRQSLKAEAERKGVRVTALAFILKAVAAALQEFPQFNASLSPDGQSLILKKYLHIGIAVDTPNGLMVPVLRDVGQKSIYTLSAELAHTSQKARDGKLGPKDMQGGCFSISSLGGIGGSGFTPIVNAPEVAILGVTRSRMQPVWNGDTFVPRLMMPLDLTYDHRVIDGATGARFMVYLCQALGDVRRLLL